MESSTCLCLSEKPRQISRRKTYGVINPTTPTGSLIVKTRFPATLAGIVSPYILGASSANHSKKFAPYETSPFASANGLPFSQVMILAMSSALSMMAWNHFWSNRARSRPVFFRNEGSASAAAWMAPSVSTLVISGIVPMTFCVAGSTDVLKHALASFEWLDNL